MHANTPLQGDAHTLDRLKQAKRHDEGEREPQGSVDPVRWLIGDLDGSRAEHDNVAYDHNDIVSWHIVSAVMVEFFTAIRAGRIDLQERFEHLASPASRAFAGHAVKQVLGEGMFLRSLGHLGHVVI